MGEQSDISTLEDRLADPYKTKHTFTIQSSNHTPWHLPNGVEDMFTQKAARGCL